MIFALCFTITVFLCSLPTGVILLTWICDINPQQHGSKNIGMSNVWRIKGPSMGLLTLLGDLLKSYLALHMAHGCGLSLRALFCIGFTAVLSHCYSIYLNGNGGKGVATAGGVLLFFAPSFCLLLAISWFLLRWLTQKASVSSLGTSLLSILLAFCFYTDLVPLIFLLCLLIAWRHKENFKRLHRKSELSAQNLPTDPL